MAYLVTDPDGRREFRWLENGRRRSRRVPRGVEGDRVLAGLAADLDVQADSRKAARDGAASTVAEADAVLRELKALGASIRDRLNEVLAWPLAYDPNHGTIIRTDRMGSEKIKAAAETGPKFERFRWSKKEGRRVGMDPTHALRGRLATKFCPDDAGEQICFITNLLDIEAELLDGDESPAARMLVDNLVLTWVHSLWADNELVWETHRVGIVPAATVALTRRAESLSNRFHRSLRLWESYCLRTRGEVAAFPPQGANRVSRYFAGAN